MKIVLDPTKRRKYLNQLMEMNGLGHVQEDENAAYCPVSLTSVPDKLKPFIAKRQTILKDVVLADAGITGYDPGQAPFSPDLDLTTSPKTIYKIDTAKIVGARYFVGHDILPSEGKGIEREKATAYNRIAVMLIDRNIRVSRMQPNRTIYLGYENFEEQSDEFVRVFKMLRNFDPGMGFSDDGVSILVGFPRDGGNPVNLEEAVYQQFPYLRYEYDGEVPIVRLRAENPEVFYEYRKSNSLKAVV